MLLEDELKINPRPAPPVTSEERYIYALDVIIQRDTPRRSVSLHGDFYSVVEIRFSSGDISKDQIES